MEAATAFRVSCKPCWNLSRESSGSSFAQTFRASGRFRSSFSQRTTNPFFPWPRMRTGLCVGIRSLSPLNRIVSPTSVGLSLTCCDISFGHWFICLVAAPYRQSCQFYELTDHEWAGIKLMLPNKPRGAPRVNDRRICRTLSGSKPCCTMTRVSCLAVVLC